MNVLFISEMLPIDTFASSVVFYRHFVRLAKDGHNVHVLTDKNSFDRKLKELPEFFKLHILPNRKWYYPPYKASGISQRLRFWDYYHCYVDDLIQNESIDILVGYVCGQFLAPFTAYLKIRTGLPLVNFFHDDTLELSFYAKSKSLYNNTSKVLKVSDRVLIASEGFIDNWQSYKDKFELLYPIPDDVQLDNTKAQSDSLVFGYSGTVYDEVIKPLEIVAGFLDKEGYRFKIIGNNKKINYLDEKFDCVECKPLFDTAKEASHFILNQCDLCIIPYPENLSEMPWIKTCFPSKLIQYCQIGIPTLVIAPESSALGQWCLKHNWLLYSNSYDMVYVRSILKRHWNSFELLQQILFFKSHMFSPDHIHMQFDGIIRGFNAINNPS